MPGRLSQGLYQRSETTVRCMTTWGLRSSPLCCKSLQSCPTLWDPSVEPKLGNFRQRLKMGSSGVVSDTNRFYILIIKKLCQHLQNGRLLVKFQMGFLWKAEEGDDAGPVPHSNKVCTPGGVLCNSPKSQHSLLDPRGEAIFIFITAFMSGWHDLRILCNEGHKEKWSTVKFPVYGVQNVCICPAWNDHARQVLSLMTCPALWHTCLTTLSM